MVGRSHRPRGVPPHTLTTHGGYTNGLQSRATLEPGPSTTPSRRTHMTTPTIPPKHSPYDEIPLPAGAQAERPAVPIENPSVGNAPLHRGEVEAITAMHVGASST